MRLLHRLTGHRRIHHAWLHWRIGIHSRLHRHLRLIHRLLWNCALLFGGQLCLAFFFLLQQLLADLDFFPVLGGGGNSLRHPIRVSATVQSLVNGIRLCLFELLQCLLVQLRRIDFEKIHGPEGAGQFLHIGVPLCGFFFQHPQDDSIQFFGDVFIVDGRWDNIFSQMLLQQSTGGVPGERWLTGQHFEETDAQTVHVCLFSGRLFQDCFRCDICACSLN